MLLLNAIVVGFVSIIVVTVVLPQFGGSRWPKSSGCINNLRQIDGAIQQWALEHKKTQEEIVKWQDITPYLKNKMICPQGGHYAIGPTATNVPTCSVAGHALPP
jgi:hypothetical protein